MTESSAQHRIDQLRAIGDSVAACKQQIDQFMDSLRWTRDKLPKAPEQLIIDDVTDETTTKARRDEFSAPPTTTKATCDVGDVFPELGDRKLKPREVTSYADINKLKRDFKRRRMKHRVTKTPPLTYTEEIRELIAIQMDIERNRLRNEDDE